MARPPLSNLPSSWAQFNRLKRIRLPTAQLVALNRFGYRYRLAKSFKGLVADGVGRSLLTYGAITKLFLAYTAYEALVPTARSLRLPGVGSLSINVVFDKDLADSVRRNSKLKDFLLTYNFREDLSNKLNLLLSGSTNDIICVAFAVRNVFAHGDLTTTDIGTGRASERNLLLSIADRTLLYCDDTFTKCLGRL